MNYAAKPGDPNMEAFLAAYAALCRAHGIMFVSYEGAWLNELDEETLASEIRDCREHAIRMGEVGREALS